MNSELNFDGKMSIKQINDTLSEGLIGWLGIHLQEISNGSLVATMPVNKNTMRPGGILHGGSNLAFAETLAGMGSMFLIDNNTHDARGISVSANHVGAASSGLLTAKAILIHQGKTTHLWDIEIFREDGKLISTARVTNMIVER